MVKKCDIVWNYYNKKIDGSQVIAFCKYCDRSYKQNAARMERHLERCEKCPEAIKRQFIQVRNDKKNKANTLGIKINEKQQKQESSMERVTDIELEDLKDWYYKNRYYMDEISETIQRDEKVIVQSKDKSHTNHNTNVQSVKSDTNATVKAKDMTQTNIKIAKIDESKEHKSSVRHKKFLPSRRISRWPLLSMRDTTYSSIQSKIYQERLLESQALRKSAELELRRKTLELEKFQWEYERDKTQSEIRWAYEMRMMQLQEEHERRIIEQNKI
ncbi:PREDICTED: uncharacterized protein LOC106787631 [Polistes canadensis]|uniref:uncharacterized protein LOC106787631 n=1 Tax=Polistes canadensis TaxID=91411 RepID=UPI000718BFAC|nr:PREDICTED: uncharacterized protein LOC106787631 [Polistes canadensis]